MNYCIVNFSHGNSWRVEKSLKGLLELFAAKTPSSIKIQNSHQDRTVGNIPNIKNV